MRSVIVSAPDYDTLELIHTARRLYQKQATTNASKKQDLSRRFVEGYKRLLLMAEPTQEWRDLQKRIQDYRDELKDLGLKDYQVPALIEEHLEEVPIARIDKVDGDRVMLTLQLFYNIVHKSILIAVSAVPMLLLNLPVGLMAGIYSERRRKTALANSKVKIKGYDVMLTEKVLFCLVMVPTLWFVYGLALALFTNLEGATIALILISMPIFAYSGIAVADAGVVQLSDLRPNLMRLFPSSRKRLAALPETRKRLRDDLRAYIRKIGPALGEIYYGKDLDWAKIAEASTSKRGSSSEVQPDGDPKKTS
jgi:glycerol-3-phosphate O-acyltransferase/dihydroxyacetone phosphate acyltransferase